VIRAEFTFVPLSALEADERAEGALFGLALKISSSHAGEFCRAGGT